MERPALFLDLDGTLAAFQPRPEDVGPEPWRSRLLEALGRLLEGRVAVVSGRTLEDIDRIVDGSVPAAAAVHGLVRRRPDGAIVRAAPHPGIARAREALEPIAAAEPGVLIEDKGLSLAAHFRLNPAAGELVVSTARRLAVEHGLKLQPGEMVAELATPGFDKGAAVRSFMDEPPFLGATPVFLGDDLTDEDAFTAVQELGGMAVLVGPARPTAARYRLGGVDAVRAWLEARVSEPAR